MAPSDEVRAAREETVRAHMAAENAGDWEAAIATFARPRYELVGTHRVYDGHDEVVRYFTDSRAAFPDQRNELIALHHADEAVIAEFWLRGTHRGEIEGLAPTGKAFSCRMVALFLFEGTDLVCERIYFDTGTIARQLA